MTNEEFEREYYPRYKSVIEAIARKAAKNDEDLWDDLVAVGTIGLLHLDLSKAKSNLDAFIRSVIRNKIIDHVRWTGYRTFERLDSYLYNNHDVVRDPVSGDAMFVHGDNELHTYIRHAPEEGEAAASAERRPEEVHSAFPHFVTKRQRLEAVREFERDGED